MAALAGEMHQGVGDLQDTSGYWKPGSLTWSTLRRSRPSRGKAAKLAVSGAPWAVDSVQRDLAGADQWLSQVAMQPRRRGQPGSVEDAAKISAAPSASESEEARLSGSGSEHIIDHASKEGCESEPEFDYSCLSVPPTYKVRRGTPSHFQASVAEDGKPVPYCRDVPFRSGVAEWDMDVAVALSSGGWCKLCIARMPHQLSEFVTCLCKDTGV